MAAVDHLPFGFTTGEQELDEIDAFETGMYSAGGSWRSTKVARGAKTMVQFSNSKDVPLLPSHVGTDLSKNSLL